MLRPARFALVARFACHDQYRLLAIDFREQALQVRDLRQIVDDDVGLVGLRVR